MNNSDPKAKKKKWLPTEEQIRKQKGLRFLTRFMQNPRLWHFTHQSVPPAIFIGLFMACMPMPFQMIPAAILGIIFRANLILAIGLVWVSNPITMPIMLYTFYQLGQWVLHSPEINITHFDVMHIIEQFAFIWQPLLVGSIIGGLLFGGIGYILSLLFLKWRRHAQ